MDLGFETIGNATLVCHDGGPVLATDPWIDGGAYFGSWTRSHEIPARPARGDRSRADYVWLSHGHPDHLSLESLERLQRQAHPRPRSRRRPHPRDLDRAGLRRAGARATASGSSSPPRSASLCVADYNQDAMLLIDVGGRLVVEPERRRRPGLGPGSCGGDRGATPRASCSALRLRRRRHDQLLRRGRAAHPAARPRCARRSASTIARMTRRASARASSSRSARCTATSAPTASGPTSTRPASTTTRDGFDSKTCELLPAVRPLRPRARRRRGDRPASERGRAARARRRSATTGTSRSSRATSRKLEAYFQRVEHLGEASRLPALPGRREDPRDPAREPSAAAAAGSPSRCRAARWCPPSSTRSSTTSSSATS